MRDRQVDAGAVLVIEDDPDILRFVSRVLELEGYRVLRAGDGDTGLEMIREKSKEISLVLLDLKLPGRDGWSVLQKMRATSKLSWIPVVILSASVAAPQRERALRMGASDYLVKPLDAASLKAAVAATLCGRRYWRRVTKKNTRAHGR